LYILYPRIFYVALYLYYKNSTRDHPVFMFFNEPVFCKVIRFVFSSILNIKTEELSSLASLFTCAGIIKASDCAFLDLT
jgi:hypothetical protein